MLTLSPNRRVTPTLPRVEVRNNSNAIREIMSATNEELPATEPQKILLHKLGINFTDYEHYLTRAGASALIEARLRELRTPSPAPRRRDRR